MASVRRSPQQKKELSYRRDHIAYGPHHYARIRKDLKISASRIARRKTESLLSQVKPEIPASEAEAITADLPSSRVKARIALKRRHLFGATPLRDAIGWQQERRRMSTGRKSERFRAYDRIASDAVSTLTALVGPVLIRTARRVAEICRSENAYKYVITDDASSADPVNRALDFIRKIAHGSCEERHALCRNRELKQRFDAWISKVRAILAKDRYAAEQKVWEEQAMKSKQRSDSK